MATETPAAPRSRVCAEGKVLLCDGYDDEVRWQEGERLEALFEERCRELPDDALAVDGPAGRLTYRELDGRANRLASHLQHDVGPGDRVALLLEDAIDSYTAMLAVLKLRATFVPLDPGFPEDRIAYICEDAEVGAILTASSLSDKLGEVPDGIDRICLDELADTLEQGSDERPEIDPGEDTDDHLAYLIYTSGTTGRPKGVAIGHPAICNFVRVAAELYGYEPDDRVYQGLTIAFDFAVEEIWVPWMVGATLFPKPGGANLLGPELQEFLSEQHITALCCVPTLLATLEDDLPELRFLLVSGESCPQDLVEAWHRPERRFLNVYGPTEATVSATWAVLEPGRPVTIGVPLPTYAVVILDPDSGEARELSEEGEIAIAGIGLADGYVNNEEKTAAAFVEDFLHLDGNPSGRLYRTGDLGRVNDNGEIEHVGRIDTQVKIRGYRIELAEIEAVLRELPGVDQAVVSTHQPEPEVEELAAYYTPADGELDEETALETLREKLPAYMVPTYLERLDELPLQPSGKVDRKALPEPKGERRLVAEGEYEAPESDLETKMAQTLAEVLGVEKVSVEANFFDELGASSLLLARFGSELRAAGLTTPSMRDVYQHPTIRGIAEAVGGEAGGAAGAGGPEFDEPELPEAIGTPHFVLAGALQLVAFLIYASAAGVAFDAGANWLTGAHGLGQIYVRALAFGGGLVLAVGLLPIPLKWLVIGRFRRARIRAWSLAYVRFWLVKTMILANPLVRLSLGTPLLNFYLRALGAKIGPGTIILTRHLPIATDLIEIGPDTVVRKDSYLNGYRARAGAIETGPVRIGAEAWIGEQTVLDIDTTVEAGATLGHASSLHAGQLVPAGDTWHGSPAQPAEEGWSYRTVDPLPCGRGRRIAYGIGQLAILLAIVAPIEAAAAALLFAHPSGLTVVPDDDAVLISIAVIAVVYVAGAVVAGALPRLLTRLLVPGRAYPLYGIHHTLQRLVSRTSNIPYLNALFGDSSAVVGYLRALGYRFGQVEQTGSNFGMEVRQEVPGLTEVRTGTMVSDGLSVMNAEYSAGSFRVVPATIAERNFLGNRLVWPGDARTGENCLLATKAMIPIGGEMRTGTGLLGSPCFEIPRTTEEKDSELMALGEEPERGRRLSAKTRHNVATMALHLLVRFVLLSIVLLIDILPLRSGLIDVLGTAGSTVLDVVIVPALYFGAVEWAVTRIHPLEPRLCSIYQVEFWRHERYWKVPSMAFISILNGTAFKGLAWRLLGVKVGPRLFDDGGAIIERGLTRIGADCTLGMGATLQGHSLEDGLFKSDWITVGDRCTIGTGGFVHYGVRLGDDAVVEADSFVMKGSEVSPGSRWRGNPASEVVTRKEE